MRDRADAYKARVLGNAEGHEKAGFERRGNSIRGAGGSAAVHGAAAKTAANIPPDALPPPPTSDGPHVCTRMAAAAWRPAPRWGRALGRPRARLFAAVRPPPPAARHVRHAPTQQVQKALWESRRRVCYLHLRRAGDGRPLAKRPLGKQL